MANEAVITDMSEPKTLSFKCATGTAIAKGEVMELTDPRTVKKISADNKPVIGIAAWEKSATDTKAWMAVHVECVAKMTVGATAATVGFLQACHAGDNTIGDADANDVDEGLTIGTALETGATGESIYVWIHK